MVSSCQLSSTRQAVVKNCQDKSCDVLAHTALFLVLSAKLVVLGTFSWPWFPCVLSRHTISLGGSAGQNIYFSAVFGVVRATEATHSLLVDDVLRVVMQSPGTTYHMNARVFASGCGGLLNIRRKCLGARGCHPSLCFSTVRRALPQYHPFTIVRRHFMQQV